MTALAARLEKIFADRRVVARQGSASPWPFEHAEPADLAAFYAACEGLEIDDGTRILGRSEIAEATRWLVAEKALHWPTDLIVIGERDDLVIVRDLDTGGVRASGGVLEAATDELEGFRRVALSVVEYLEMRLGFAIDEPLAPERAAQHAIEAHDAEALEKAVQTPFYPGADRDLSRALMTLGVFRATGGDAKAALEAFERAAKARVRAVRRGAEATEHVAAYRAFAAALDAAGASDVAQACRDLAARRLE